MKKNNKIVLCLEQMHSIFMKVILITGLALATQNVMAKKHHPHCDHKTCCHVDKEGYLDNRGGYKRCIAKSTGMWTTCDEIDCEPAFDADVNPIH